nr:immunoglobulin light chain junction region [Macaca mulatta]MOW00341.1 immunoglobulin light chain junction region [Macaca mulatta]
DYYCVIWNSNFWVF